MDIVDIRDAFQKRNKNCLQAWLRQLPPPQAAAIQLLPLIFHLDSRLLPGYNGPDVAHGIYGYTPEKNVIGLARKVSNRFHHEQAGAMTNVPLDALYLKYSELNQVMSLWLVHASGMKATQINALEDKMVKVNAWLRSRGLEIQTNLVTEQTFITRGLRPEANEIFASAFLFLDAFYAQAFLLAGKYPLWWLVPPELEDHYDDFSNTIKIARFVNEFEYLNLGGLSGCSQHDLMKQAMNHVHDVQKSPEKAWPQLMMLNLQQKVWPKIDGLAVRTKRHVILDDLRKEITALNMLRELMQESMEDMKQAEHLMSPEKMLGMLQQNTGSPSVLQKLAADSATVVTANRREFDALRFIQASRALMREISLVFAKIVSRYKHHADDNAAQQQLALAQNMRLFLSESAQRVPLFVSRSDVNLLQPKIIFRHVLQPTENWQLTIEEDDELEKILFESSSLLAVIAWVWLNHVADSSSQVSVNCPLRIVRQVDAWHVLSVLLSQLNRQEIVTTARSVFDKPREPTSALLFIHLIMDEELRLRLEKSIEESNLDKTDGRLQVENFIGHCEQLVVSNWGDVQVQRFPGEIGVLHCLCDWLMCGLALPKPLALPLQAFGYAAGTSTYLAQRTNEIYQEMATFFLRKNNVSGRFIVRFGQHYYCVRRHDLVLDIQTLGDETALLQFLEMPNPEFVETSFERLTMLAMPLRDIYQRNKPDVIQLFFRIVNRSCDSWVLDENGTLCHFRQDWYERDGYLTRWLYLLRNVRNRMKRISYQNKELPALELNQLGSNRLGAIEFTKLGTDDFTPQRNFIDLQVTVEANPIADRLSVVCDGKKFDYPSYGEAVLPEMIQYINARLMGEGRKPVYVGDVDVPLRLFNVTQRDEIESAHFLKYVRNFENRLLQLLAV